mmetsp:Transcript_79442/g.199645  ORF Transcript_79442/g.199645 Transcript_79442/m.199645 type:complete len:484 (-) Transcript_79442:80-1531(-)
MQGVFYEFRSTVHGWSKVRTDWRRLGLQALPVVATATAGTAALYTRKQAYPPDAELLTRRACFECKPASTLAGRGLLPSPVAVERALEEAGANIASLRRAAQRLRGPIERDLLEVEASLLEEKSAAGGGDLVSRRRKQLYEGLVAAWRQAGFLSEPEAYHRPRSALGGLDYVTQQDESYGRDVGCEVPLCLLRGEADQPADPSSLTAVDHLAAASALEQHGVVLLRSLLRDADIQALRDRLHMQISALDRRSAKGFPPVREYDASPLQDADPDLEPVVSTPGRRHFYLRGRALEDIVKGVQAGALPLVWEHLTRAAQATGLPVGRRPYVSEVQLLVTDPCAVDQFWHVDNTAPGLTLFVPLTEVPEDLGPTLFLPGTHHLLAGPPGLGSRIGALVASFFASEGVVVGSMGAGDALLYDSRIVHRGAANRKYDRTRVALVFRYDFERPPGVGVLGTQLVSWTGNVLSQMQRLYAALPGGARATP